MMAQTTTVPGQDGIIIEDKPASIEERKRQYAICKVRGHQVGGYPSGTIAIYPPPVQHPYCKFCGTTFWTETIERESGAPE